MTVYRCAGSGYSRHRFCPVHGYPLRAWHRVGKWECPVRPCPYVERHECELPGHDGCDCETLEMTFNVPDDHNDAMRESCQEALEIMRLRRYDLTKAAGEKQDAADVATKEMLER